MARWIDSWLPASPAGPGTKTGHPGEKFGLPADGVNATASFGRRLAAIFVDWMVAYVVTLAFLGVDALGAPNTSWTILGVWYILTVLPTAIFGTTAGKVALGLRVARTDMARFVGVPRALLRTVLIALVVPPLARDHDG
ncbi:MAG: RDD family protein, partial [Pseudonocardia sp.]|nr:RDD family protein [Pseudonocardia sp.]